MTTYIYACDKCEVGEEVEHSMKECATYRLHCPTCGTRMHRVPQACGIKMAFRPGYFPQLETVPNGRKSAYAHVSTEAELHDKASRNGMTVNKIGF